mgnify:CR=1 FL=1
MASGNKRVIKAKKRYTAVLVGMFVKEGNMLKESKPFKKWAV